MLSDLFDTVMDMFGGRKSRVPRGNRDSRSDTRGMVDGLFERDDSWDELRRHRNGDWDTDEPYDPESRGHREGRRFSVPDFD